jgi:basic amino acid/polyamine antiporter, APA family
VTRSPNSDDLAATAKNLPRGFGFGPALAVVVSSMVGGGILVTSGLAAVQVRSHGAMLALWVVGGLVALCGALTLAELATALPRSGGEYVILSESLGPLAAFLGGWVSLLLGFAAPIAASAAAASRYFASGYFGGSSVTGERVAASLAIAAFALVQMRGHMLASRLQLVVTGAIVLALAAFVVVGLAVAKAPFSSLAHGAAPRAGAWLFSLVYISYAYTGWNGAAYIAGEVRDPRKLPLTFVVGAGLVMLLYVGVNLVYALAVPIEDLIALAKGDKGLDAVEPIAELAAARLFGIEWARRSSAFFALLLLGSASALLLTGSRVAFAMARAGQFPRIAGELAPKTQTPVFATTLIAGASIALLWSGRFEQIIVYTGVGLALFSLLTIGSIFILRVKRPELHRPFRVPFYPFVPAVYLAATAVLSVAAFVERPVESCLALSSILLGVPVYLVFQRTRPEAAGG